MHTPRVEAKNVINWAMAMMAVMKPVGNMAVQNLEVTVAL